MAIQTNIYPRWKWTQQKVLQWDWKAFYYDSINCMINLMKN